MAESMHDCKRCGKPILDPRRTKYCSEGCADSAAHEKRLVRLSRGKLQLAKFHVYDYRKGPQS